MFEAGIFEQRRENLMEKMGDGSVGIWVGAPELIRSRDSNFRYRPSSDVLYLTGFEEPGTIVVLRPSDEDGNRFTLFVRPRNEEREIWEGRRLGPERAKEELGADQVFSIEEFEEQLPKLLVGADRLYYQLNLYPTYDTTVLKGLQASHRQRRQGKDTPGQIVEAASLLDELRLFKSPEEIEVMRKAGSLTAEAHRRAMAVTRPGMKEFQLEALIAYHFRVNGCTEVAYSSIVGGGGNAAVLHYIENHDTLRDGDLVLIDAGAEYKYYAGDITRTYPVNGKFSPQQRDVYQLVLEAELAAIEVCRPGNRFNDVHDKAVRVLTEGLVSLGVLKGSVDELIEEGAFKSYYMHKTGHWLGMDVHDVGNYFEADKESRKLEPGMVLTVEPGLYFHPEFCKDESAKPYVGMGIRVEDDILITESGYENLTHEAPKTVEDIEAVVGSEELP